MRILLDLDTKQIFFKGQPNELLLNETLYNYDFTEWEVVEAQPNYNMQPEQHIKNLYEMFQHIQEVQELQAEQINSLLSVVNDYVSINGVHVHVNHAKFKNGKYKIKNKFKHLYL